MAYTSINPATNELLKEFEIISDKSLEKKLAISGRSFNHWSSLTFQKRLGFIKEIGKVLLENKNYHSGLMATEMGKPITQAMAEVEKCALLCDYYFEHAEEILVRKQIPSSMPQTYVSYEPIGAVLAVMPWNFPYWQVFRFLIPNLILGNTGLLKHASNVPQCASAIENICLEAGIPEGVFQNLYINYNQVENVIAHAAVQGVTLTGSEKAGSVIAALAGKHIKKSVLELGGSDPFIVFADADLENAVKTGVSARMQNNGQSCIASKRFLIQKDIFSSYKTAFADRVNKLIIGNPLDPKTEIGPLARPFLVEELDTQLQSSVSQGAVVETGGKRLESNYYQPTVVSSLREGMPLYDKETFGPVASFFMFETDEEAVEIANCTEFGLGASVWTNNARRIEKLSKRIKAGTVAFNGIVKSDPAVPFGGIKKSGYGRELSGIGLKEFANLKAINIFNKTR